MIRVEEACALVAKEREEWLRGLSRGAESTMVRAEDAAYGARLAQGLKSDRAYPPIERVMMDGIAISFAAYQEGVRSFEVAGIGAAGKPALELQSPKQCFEVMTGAPLPKNTDLVVPYEEIEIASGVATLTTNKNYEQWSSIHRKGSDLEAGVEVLPRGSALNGPRVGIAHSFGAGEIELQSSPKILVISTGDELLTDTEPHDHQLRLSNAPALKSLLKQFGYHDVHGTHLKDDKTSLREHFNTAITEYDALVYSGGVSKGKYDFLPEVWAEAGVEKIFHGVKQRPGKPLFFGKCSGKTVGGRAGRTVGERSIQVWGLPGNPVSSLVCLRRYFIEAAPVMVRLSEEIHFANDLQFFAPVKLSVSSEAVVEAVPIQTQNSGDFAALAHSDGFVELPQDISHFKAGEVYSFYSWRPWPCES